MVVIKLLVCIIYYNDKNLKCNVIPSKYHANKTATAIKSVAYLDAGDSSTINVLDAMYLSGFFPNQVWNC